MKYRFEVPRYSNTVSGKQNLRSRSQDERSRALGHGGGGGGGGTKSGRRTSPSPLPTSTRNSVRFDRPVSKLDKQPMSRKTHDGLIIHVHSDDVPSDRSPKTSNKTPRYNRHGRFPVPQEAERREETETRLHSPNSAQSSTVSVLVEMANSLSLDSVESIGELTSQLKNCLLEKKTHFDKLNTELNKNQKSIIKVLAEMKAAQSQLTALGGDASEGLLADGQDELVCAGAARPDGDLDIEGALDSVALLPNSLMSCCDAALRGQQDTVQWLNTLLTSKDKGIGMHELTRKVQDFTRDHVQLVATLDSTKDKFNTQLTEAVDIIRKGWSERDKLVREKERLAVEVAELTSQNGDLHKQLLSADHPKYIRADKSKIEELEKELKEERCKRSIVRERLTRADGLNKVATVRVSDLEEQLETAQAEVRALQTSVHQLQEQNLKIQMQSDKELEELTESLKKNMTEFQEVAEAREQLEIAKNELETQMQESFKQYNSCIECIKSELITTANKLTEAEIQRNDFFEEKNKLETELKSTTDKVKELESQNKSFIMKLADKELELDDKEALQKELAKTTRVLEKCESELEDLKRKVKVKDEVICDLERNSQRHHEMKETLTVQLEDKKKCIMEIKSELMNELKAKADLITELKKKLAELEDELQESESKVELYEHQLQSLKSNLGYVPHDDADASMDSFAELHQLIMEQRTKLIGMAQQNGDLAEALQKKDTELGQRERALEAQHAAYENEERERAERDRDQARTLEQLHKTVEMRAQAEFEVTRKLAEKTEEVNILLSNVEMRKQEINQLEKIILTLEDELCGINEDRNNQHDIIVALERRKMDSKMIFKRKDEGKKFDHLISILEAEIGKPKFDEFADETGDDSFSFSVPRVRGHRECKGARGISPTRTERSRTGDSHSSLGGIYHSPVKKTSPMIVKNVRRESAYLSEHDESRDPQYGTNVDNHGWISGPQNNINVYHTLQTEIGLQGVRGRRDRSPSPAGARSVGAGLLQPKPTPRAPRELLTRRPLLTLGAPRGHRSQRSLDNAAYNISSTFDG